MLVKPEVQKYQNMINKFNPAYFEFSELFDFWWNKFDLFILNCEHLKNDDNNQYCEVMRAIQTISALIFFIAIHVPLSRLNTIFCFITALVPVMLNLGTKFWFYEKANQIVCFFFRYDVEAKNIVKKPKIYGQSNLSIQIKLTKWELETQENCVFATTFFIGVFFSLIFNYTY